MTMTPRERAEPLLFKLRDAGWRVAIHNDYMQNGEARTFWLFTHPCGRWVKGEGRFDEDALAQCWEASRAILAALSPAPEAKQP